MKRFGCANSKIRAKLIRHRSPHHTAMTTTTNLYGFLISQTQDLRLLISENVENWYPHVKHLTMETVVIGVGPKDMVRLEVGT